MEETPAASFLLHPFFLSPIVCTLLSLITKKEDQKAPFISAGGMWKMAQETELSMRGPFPKVTNQINRSFLGMEEGESGDPWNQALEDSSTWKDRAWEDVSHPPTSHPHVY